MPERRPYVAGNWKMHKTAAEARSYVEDLAGRLPGNGSVDVGVCVRGVVGVGEGQVSSTPLRTC